MKKKLYFLLTITALSFNVVAQVGIGTSTPHPSSKLEISSTNSGFLMPRMTQTQRDGIVSPATGLMIYQTDNTPGFYCYTGTGWSLLAGGNWLSSGSNIYTPNSSNVGIGTNNPVNKLHVNGGYVQIDNDNSFAITNSTVTNNRCGLAMSVQANPKAWMFWNNPAGLLNITTDPSALRSDILMDASGTLGIGSIPSDHKVNIYSNVIQSNDNTQLLKLSGRNPVLSFCDENGNPFGYLKSWTHAPFSPFTNGMVIGAIPGYPIFFSTNSYGLSMIIADNGNIGIGSALPVDKLSVTGGNIRIDNNNSFVITNSNVTNNNCGIAMRVQNAGKAYMYWNNNDATLDLSTTSDGSRKDLWIDNSGHTHIGSRLNISNWFFAQSDADIGLFIISGGSTLEEGYFDHIGGDYHSVSDRLRKRDFRDLPPVLNDVMKLKAQQYHFTNSPDGSPLSIGFIAQEVRELFPAVVDEKTDKDGTSLLSLNYREFTVIAIQAIQEQQAIIDKQAARIDLLEKRLDRLEKIK